MPFRSFWFTLSMITADIKFYFFGIWILVTVHKDSAMLSADLPNNVHCCPVPSLTCQGLPKLPWMAAQSGPRLEDFALNCATVLFRF